MAGSRLARGVVVSMLVGSGVSIGHWLAPEASWWPVAHAVLPAIVFSSGAWNAGCRSPNKSLLLRGALTIAAVAVAFDAAHGIRELPAWAPVVSSYLIPFVVTLLGAAQTGPPAPPPGRV